MNFVITYTCHIVNASLANLCLRESLCCYWVPIQWIRFKPYSEVQVLNTYDTQVVQSVYPKKYAHGFCFAVFVVIIHWLIFPYPSGLLHWHCGNLTIAPVPAKQPGRIWINTSCEFIMNDCITTTKQGTTKPCAYFLGYTVYILLVNYNYSSCFMLVASTAIYVS